MPQPRYAQLAAAIRRKIQSRELPPGAKLPSVRQLAEDADVSEIVARQAIRSLHTEGLITTRVGSGAFVATQRSLTRVAPHRYRRRHGTTAWADEAQQAGVNVNVNPRTVKAVADDYIADRLAIEPEALVTQTDYLVTMDDQVISTSRCWEPLDLTGDTDIEIPDEGPYGHLGITDRFATIGIHTREVEETLNFRPPSDDEQRQLDAPPGMWLIEIAQTFHADERIVEAANILYRPDRYTFVYRLPIPTDDTPPDDDQFPGVINELL